MSKISNVLTMIEYLSTGKKYSINELSEKLIAKSINKIMNSL